MVTSLFCDGPLTSWEELRSSDNLLALRATLPGNEQRTLRASTNNYLHRHCTALQCPVRVFKKGIKFTRSVAAPCNKRKKCLLKFLHNTTSEADCFSFAWSASFIKTVAGEMLRVAVNHQSCFSNHFLSVSLGKNLRFPVFYWNVLLESTLRSSRFYPGALDCHGAARVVTRPPCSSQIFNTMQQDRTALILYEQRPQNPVRL